MWQFNFVPLLGGGMPKSEQNRGVATVYNDRAKFYLYKAKHPVPTSFGRTVKRLRGIRHGQ